MTTFDSVVWQPSVLDMARAGNYRALSYWINTFLLPQGIHARVENAKAGCLQIFIESPHSPEPEQIVKSICHQIWRLNSEVIEGVRIVARAAGNSDILWKQSVRIVTPANQRRSQTLRHPRLWDSPTISFKTLRALLMAGTAVTSFVLSATLTYHSIVPQSVSTVFSEMTPVAQVRPSEVRTAKETLPVIRHNQVLNPDDPIVTLMFGQEMIASPTAAAMASSSPPIDIYREADFSTVSLKNTGADMENTLNRIASEGVDMVTSLGLESQQTQTASLQAMIHYVGGDQFTPQSGKPTIIDVKDQRIAYLAYSDANTDTQESLKAQIEEDIRAIRNSVDWVIINYHWGSELSEVPSEWQTELSHFAIDQGADLVVGYHPQSLQGAEIYKGRPVAYSMGNFIFGEHSESDYDTAMLKVSLKDRKMKVEFLPVQVRSYQPQIVNGEQGDEILHKIEELSLSFNRPMTSPMIVYSSKTEAKVTNIAPSGEFDSKKSASQKRLIEMPVFPGDIIQRNYLEEQLKPATELPKPADAQSSGEADPFIKQPFIHEPLNKPVSVQGEPHSKAPALPEPSFNLSYYSKPKDLQSLSLAATSKTTSLKTIDLPIFV